MNSFDDIFEGHVSQRGQTNQPFDKEAWAEKKQAERQSVYDLADTTAVEVSTFSHTWMYRLGSAAILPPTFF